MSQQTNVEPPQSPKIHLNSSADFDYLVSKWAIRGWQNGCVAGLPVFLVSLAGRRMLPKSSQTLLERVLKVSWMSGAAGSASGGLIGYVRYRGMDRHELRKKRVEMQFAEKNVRRDGMAAVGAGLSATLTTALFWYHARLYNLFLGGLAVGTTCGVGSALMIQRGEDPSTSDSTDTREKEAAIKAGVVGPDE